MVVVVFLLDFLVVLEILEVLEILDFLEFLDFLEWLELLELLGGYCPFCFLSLSHWPGVMPSNCLKVLEKLLLLA